MRISDLKADQLEAYLTSLTPKAAALLVREVERDKLRGGTKIPHDFVLERARRHLQEVGFRAERTLTPLRVFCMPFEDCLVDVSTSDKQVGRIRRSSISPVWQWLEVTPCAAFTSLMETYAQPQPDTGDAILGKSCAETYRSLSDFIISELAPLQPGSKDYLKMSSRMGGEVVLQDALDMAQCLAAGGTFLQLRSRIPVEIRELRPEDVKLYSELYAEMAGSAPNQAYMVLMALLRRTGRVSDIMNIVCKIVGSEEPEVIAGHPVSIVGSVIVHDIEVVADAVRRSIRGRTSVDEIKRGLAQFHALANGLTDSIELSPNGYLGNRLVAIRSTLSATIRDEISSAPRLVKAALFPRRASVVSDVAPRLVAPNQENLRDAEFAVELIISTRFYLDQLSIHADYRTVRKEVEHFVEAVGERVLHELQVSDEFERPNCISYLDAAAWFVEKLFGEEEKALLLRRGKAALLEGEKAEHSSISA